MPSKRGEHQLMWMLYTALFIAALLVPAFVFDAKRRRKGLPVKGPDGLRGFSTNPDKSYGGFAPTGIHSGGALGGGDGGGCGDGGGGGGGGGC